MDALPTLRPEQPEDASFVLDLFMESRLAVVAPLPWTSSQKLVFLNHQYQLQSAHYRANYSNASFSIIQLQSHPIGRLYVDRTSSVIHLIDITLDAEPRNQGIGGRLLSNLLIEAAETGRVVRLHVERSNPASRLYKRLGFGEINDRGIYVEMEWPSPA